MTNDFILNKTGRKRLVRLRRRLAFLAARISRGSNPWDNAEHNALDWAIRFIELEMTKPEAPVDLAHGIEVRRRG